MDSERITVEGMSCGHCVARVRAAVETIAGVEIEVVEIGEVWARIDPSCAGRAEVVAAIRAAGYCAE